MTRKPDDTCPPWEQPGWAPPQRAQSGTREYPEGELLARMRKRLELTRGPSVFLKTVKVTPDREKLVSMTKLKNARKKVKELGAVVRDEAFDDWLGKCVVIAQTPEEWTQAAVLYASYIKHASRYGNNRGDKALAKEELATETAWGKMMGAAYPNKKRRARGWYYPARPKRGA
jgi:hypothetical protein